ncbi:NmrA/HSCARG family protein [Lysobacter sp. KIS68-7]|uniref:NmrA/HSCARG family protein n=1 Tax=Lysobacter sp. KIS68-7 TaxID=2904252 RepID=UPI001E5EA1B3|nr:NmrA/HSCARG family protein [Lysobacter sp. KIS68-7]UHQ19165.1 NmrA/HSCARG family protein [Lysobacter sp. KIS68-7]
MTDSTKTIAVVGATGAQGGGLARAILDDPKGGFRVRAITRHADSDKARALAAAGAEVVAADLDDEASLERALKGAYGAFFVTNFWEHFSPDKELAQARNLAQAAKAAGVKHIVWSTLEDTRKKVPLSDDRMPTLMEKYKVPHFDAKGESDALFEGLPTTWLATSFYWDNLIYFGMNPKPGADGVLEFVLPMDDAKMPGIAAEDIGRSAYGLFQAGDAFIGKHVAIAGEHLNGKEMASALSDALGREVRHAAVSPAQFRGFGFPGADDLGNMFQYKRDFEADFRGPRDVEATRKLNPRLQSFRQWLAANASRIPTE